VRATEYFGLAESESAVYNELNRSGETAREPRGSSQRTFWKENPECSNPGAFRGFFFPEVGSPSPIVEEARSMQWKYELPPVENEATRTGMCTTAQADENLIEEILRAAGLEQLD